MKKGYHVTYNQKTGIAKCNHCGASYNHNGMLPAPVVFTTRVMNMFFQMHKDCPPPVMVMNKEGDYDADE